MSKLLDLYEDVFQQIDELTKSIEQDMKELKKIKEPEIRAKKSDDRVETVRKMMEIRFFIGMNHSSKILIRAYQALLMTRMMGIVTKGMILTLEQVADKGQVDKIRKEQEEQKQKVIEVLEPLKTEIKKSLERQKRYEGLYR